MKSMITIFCLDPHFEEIFKDFRCAIAIAGFLEARGFVPVKNAEADFYLNQSF